MVGRVEAFGEAMGRLEEELQAVYPTLDFTPVQANRSARAENDENVGSVIGMLGSENTMDFSLIDKIS